MRYLSYKTTLLTILGLTLALLSEPGQFSTLAAGGQDDRQMYRPGLRNSFLGHQLSAGELDLVLAQLRQQTGFVQMRFDEAGFLTIDDRARIEGGSAAARALLLAAIDGSRSIILQSHNRLPKVTFARVGEGTRCIDWKSGAQISVDTIEIDFADFNHLRGDREVLKAFDQGFAILHELCHTVLKLHDPAAGVNAAGDCESYVNRIRRELSRPERQSYVADGYWQSSSASGSTSRIAELIFTQTEPHNSAKTRTLYLRWDAQQVGNTGWQPVPPAVRERTGSRATAP